MLKNVKIQENIGNQTEASEEDSSSAWFPAAETTEEREHKCKMQEVFFMPWTEE